MEKTALSATRSLETENLRFLAFLCLVQTILGGIYVVENTLGSDIWSSSPLLVLREDGLAAHDHHLHQCSYGASIGDELVKKPTTLLANVRLLGLERKCTGGHKHKVLRGGGCNWKFHSAGRCVPGCLL